MKAKNRDCHNETHYFVYSLQTLIENIKLVVCPPDLPTNLLISQIYDRPSGFFTQKNRMYGLQWDRIVFAFM